MKVYNLIIFIIFISCVSQKEKTAEENISKVDIAIKKEIHIKPIREFKKIHEFKINDQVIGEVFVHYINTEVFDTLYIVKTGKSVNDTLYSIERYTLKNKFDTDIEVSPKNFYGYKIALLKNNYIVLYALGNKGNDISDPINIQWIKGKNLFEVFKGL